jgi:hypothetical protein
MVSFVDICYFFSLLINSTLHPTILWQHLATVFGHHGKDVYSTGEIGYERSTAVPKKDDPIVG